MDVHREFAQIAVSEDGLVRDEGRIGVTPKDLRAWVSTLRPDDEVALEATGNSDAIATLLSAHVARVVVSNPMKTRAIAEAKVKTDKVDARILAQLLAVDFLPPVWLPDERTRMLRRQVARRGHLVRQRTRLKNQVHGILNRNLVPTPPVSDLFGGTGRHWLSRQELPGDERSTVEALVRQLDFHGEELKVVDRELAGEALPDPVVRRLMTIPGVDAISAISIVAAVGDFSRFGSADKLVAYFGLNPKVRQSGNSAPVHGRITKAGRAQVRGVLVEAAWSASRAPGPLRSFYQRIKARRGFQVAIVATARKMSVLAWHLVTKDQDYAFARPSFVAHKRRKLELTAGMPSQRGNRRGTGYEYNDKQHRTAEKALVEQAERNYASWSPGGNHATRTESVRSLDDFIRRADDLPDFHVVVQERHELSPGRTPEPDDGWVAGAPDLGELLEPCRGGSVGGGGVDGLQIAGDLLPVLLGCVAETVAQQVDHADSRCQPCSREGFAAQEVSSTASLPAA